MARIDMSKFHVLITAMVATVTACGAGKNNAPPTIVSAPVSVPAAAAIPPPVATPAVAAEPVVVPAPAVVPQVKVPVSSGPAITDRIPDSLGWPPETKVVRFTETAHIFSGASESSAPLGKVMRGTTTTWTHFLEIAPLEPPDKDRKTSKPKRSKRKSKTCRVWVEIEPSGWVCEQSLASSKDKVATAVPQPPLSKGEIMPGSYFLVREGALTYASVADVKAQKPRGEPLVQTMLRGGSAVDVDGVSFQQTNKGLIDSKMMVGLSASDFAGIDLATTPQQWPFAMISVGKRGAVIVRAEPDAKAKKVATRPWRSTVMMGVEQNGFVAIGENQWVARTSLRVFSKQTVPKGIAADGQWIDVDLDEQTAVAYQGDKPMYATVVSSGRVDGTTPTGMFRIRSKAATMRMAGEPGTAEKYDVGEIPWAMRFKKGVFFHASYWHDGYGTKHSHGCVNLSPRDAKFLYTWAGPHVPDGWTELEVAKNQGTVVRVRNAATPEPPWYEYTDEPATALTDDSSEP
jgi:lipoprotein-anchoring transpeptidase ErfK/SrfK